MAGAAFSSKGLERIGRVVARDVARGDAPGAVWLVARGGDVHAGAVGRAGLDDPAPLRCDALFRISSMTKPITAVAALSCVEDGLFRLDEPVDRLLPELADRRVLEHEDAPLTWTVPARRPILVRDLFTFTMGLGIVMAPPGTVPLADALVELALGQGPPAPDVMPEPDEWMRRLGSLPLLHHPGSRWAYNTGADVLGVLVARATGHSFADAVAERVLEPLAMVDTGFWVPPGGTRPAGPGLPDRPGDRCPAPPRPARRAVEPAPGLPLGGGGPGVDGRRRGRLRPDAPRRRPRPCRSGAVAGIGRGHDHRSAHGRPTPRCRARRRLVSTPTGGVWGSGW